MKVIKRRKLKLNLMKKKDQPSKPTEKTENNGWKVVPPELKAYSPEWFLFNYLDNWTEEDLDVAIRNDVRPDLTTYAEMILDQTIDFFMNLVKLHRPDLAKRAQTRDGREWVKRIVKSATALG